MESEVVAAQGRSAVQSVSHSLLRVVRHNLEQRMVVQDLMDHLFDIVRCPGIGRDKDIQGRDRSMARVGRLPNRWVLLHSHSKQQPNRDSAAAQHERWNSPSAVLGGRHALANGAREAVLRLRAGTKTDLVRKRQKVKESSHVLQRRDIVLRSAVCHLFRTIYMSNIDAQ